MVKQIKKASSPGTGGQDSGCRPASGQGTNYSPPDLWNKKGPTEEFAPTSAEPIPQRQQMAGVK